MNINERVAVLESEFKQAEVDIEALKIKVAYYDKMALKWGGACMGILVFGAVVGGHFDKLKEKIIEWFL